MRTDPSKLSTWEMEAGKSVPQRHPQLRNEFKASLGYMRSHLKEEKKEKKVGGEGSKHGSRAADLDSYGIESLVGMILLTSLSKGSCQSLDRTASPSSECLSQAQKSVREQMRSNGVSFAFVTCPWLSP